MKYFLIIILVLFHSLPLGYLPQCNWLLKLHFQAPIRLSGLLGWNALKRLYLQNHSIHNLPYLIFPIANIELRKIYINQHLITLLHLKFGFFFVIGISVILWQFFLDILFSFKFTRNLFKYFNFIT